MIGVFLESEEGWEEHISPNSASSEIFSEHAARYEFTSTLAGKRTLDAACGVGYGSALLNVSGRREVIGLDISLDACRYARQHYGASVVCGDVSKLPFAEDVFDLAVSFETIEHIPVPDKLLSQLFRVCKPNALLVLSTPNNRVYPAGNAFHVRQFSREEILRLIEENGFKVVTMMGQLFRWYPALWARRKIVKALPGLRRIKKFVRHLFRAVALPPVTMIHKENRTVGKAAAGTERLQKGASHSRRFVPRRMSGIRACDSILAPTYFVIVATKPGIK